MVKEANLDKLAKKLKICWVEINLTENGEKGANLDKLAKKWQICWVKRNLMKNGEKETNLNKLLKKWQFLNTCNMEDFIGFRF